MKPPLHYPDQRPGRLLMSSSPGYFQAVDQVCRGMREEEQRQHMAVVANLDIGHEDYDPRIAAIGVINLQGVAGFYLGDDGNPMAVGGFTMDVVPGVWQSWMVGTDEAWARYWRDLTKGSRWMMAQLFEGGARRLETSVIASRTEAQEWFIRFLGMQLEGVRRAYCPTGEDVLMYSMTAADWRARWEDVDGRSG